MSVGIYRNDLLFGLVLKFLNACADNSALSLLSWLTQGSFSSMCSISCLASIAISDMVSECSLLILDLLILDLLILLTFSLSFLGVLAEKVLQKISL